MKCYKVEDVICTLADQWRFEQEMEYPDTAEDIEEWKKVARELYEDLPVIDIVRCEDCMFSKVYQNDSSGVEGRFCEAFTQVRMVLDDDFCSYGERIEE